TGDTARINRRVGGTFSVFGGYATGKTLRLEKDKVIVQAWRSTDFGKDDPDSKAMFHFLEEGGRDPADLRAERCPRCDFGRDQAGLDRLLLESVEGLPEVQEANRRRQS